MSSAADKAGKLKMKLIGNCSETAYLLLQASQEFLEYSRDILRLRFDFLMNQSVFLSWTAGDSIFVRAD
jgi:hypothetical protein